ncbi:TRAP transporter permease [Pseudothauera lacus]|uniref:C4-dicarboxylate ABC transporter n=1 Tax=Pseudothauera lacus TaxID=2136175 RepID=A0A2T4IB21_9RHOO|nr:TRAP transporter permease [Pseudothauera lacus]PTD94963.1 C4-dicarboxylate ABC transporter [Pseudothauera lacus]
MSRSETTTSNTATAHHELSDAELEQIVAEADTGGRKPVGAAAKLLFAVAICWSLFQLWIASPLPFSLGIFILNDTESRAIHLAFAVFLAFAAYPALKSSPRDYIPVQDWLLALAGAFCAGYLFLFYAEVATRPGLPTTLDLVAAVCGMVLLLEAARRALGLPMVILAAVFLIYIFFGPYMPDIIAHRGASLNKGMNHLWLSTEGVFGVALGVSAGFIFLFVLFGALLETAGAGNYFIKSAIALLGHLRGGPAKAAVVASASTGLISGSSIANVVTTGTFTIPLIKRVGYRPDKAAAVEVASSVNGQLMPPVMGAAAFLMVEFVGIPYTQVLKHALLPALISYIALFYIVHLEAMKSNLQGIPRRNPSPWQRTAISTTMTLSGLVLLAGVIYYGFGWIKDVAGDASFIVVSLLMFAAYIGLIALCARYPELHMEDPKDGMEYLPEVKPTLMAGLHFLLPVAALIWNLVVEQLSPGLSAFWATMFLIFILVTQRPLFAWFRKTGNYREATAHGFHDLFSGLATGARNMIAIGIATAAAGIIVGTVTLTGVGLVMTELVEIISGGNIMVMLVMVAVICLILGMGLPTTANYIVVASLMAPVIVELGAQNGLLVPLIAVHMFVFYFGLMADVTPPVGLASYAAAGIANSDPIRTGLTAFGYSARTAILPFMFIFNTQLLMIGIDSWWQLALTVVSAIVASMTFAAATQGWFFARNRIHETVLLLLITFSLFRPGFWMDMIHPPFEELEGGQLLQLAEQAPPNSGLRIWIEGTNADGRDISKGVLLPLGPTTNAEGEPLNARARLAHSGLMVMAFGEDLQVAAVQFKSQAQRLGIEQGFVIQTVELPVERPAKEWIFIPTLALLALVIALQWRRPRYGGTA